MSITPKPPARPLPMPIRSARSLVMLTARNHCFVPLGTDHWHRIDSRVSAEPQRSYYASLRISCTHTLSLCRPPVMPRNHCRCFRDHSLHRPTCGHDSYSAGAVIRVPPLIPSSSTDAGRPLCDDISAFLDKGVHLATELCLGNLLRAMFSLAYSQGHQRRRTYVALESPDSTQPALPLARPSPMR